MLKAINTKILIVVLAVLAAIGAELVHIHEVNIRALAILQQQQDDANAVKKHDAETWDFVRKQRQKNNTAPVNVSKTWITYLP